jgi:glycosyltransferase involved in cell wall biosynthesis
MKIGLYIEHGVGNGVGGAELMMAYLASAWSRSHDVDLVHHRPPLTPERFSLFSSDDFSRFRMRHVPREPEPPAHWSPARRYRSARDWQASISEPYDLFVNCTHWRPCFSHARRGVLLVLFPFYTPDWMSGVLQQHPLWKQLRHRLYYGSEWRRRLATYDHHLAISNYSAEWARRRWRIACRIVHPPVDIDFATRQKDDLIVSVGRFSTMAHTKKQLEMVRAFVALHEGGLQGWEYACVGGLNARRENHDYFERVRDAGRRAPVSVEANVERGRVRALLERGRVFWHATGLGEDARVHPELAEHFGIATVEAMAAGCVPVVFDGGGQREIVTHGENGYLWNTPDELKAYTRRLTADVALWARLSEAAQRRARDFSRERFLTQMSDLSGVELPAVSIRGAAQLAVT